MSTSLEIPHTCAHKREYTAHFHGIRGNDPGKTLRSLGQKHQMWRRDQSFFLKRNLETRERSALVNSSRGVGSIP